MKTIYRGEDWRTKAPGIYREAYEHHALRVWLDGCGKSLEWLLAEIAEKQPGDKLEDTLGIGPELPNPILDDSRMHQEWRFYAFRGLQELVCNRSWQRRPEQMDLFA